MQVRGPLRELVDGRKDPQNQSGRRSSSKGLGRFVAAGRNEEQVQALAFTTMDFFKVLYLTLREGRTTTDPTPYLERRDPTTLPEG